MNKGKTNTVAFRENFFSRKLFDQRRNSRIYKRIVFDYVHEKKWQNIFRVKKKPKCQKQKIKKNLVWWECVYYKSKSARSNRNFYSFLI